ncbi:hypothetical protein K435DRAFT_877917 [Dendrothele bispora CBS 962.96]|uniref:Uncharacterized protein n=1 Tax=Dendrothele bispora (strain CBS 962.96) TaxID=1314807 RepID=A0A4S8KQ16_DENBC|nr:hypothetical protein K435DRAFT_877917 [Dendrothele bispora CBS 962.96]
MNFYNFFLQAWERDFLMYSNRRLDIPHLLAIGLNIRNLFHDDVFFLVQFWINVSENFVEEYSFFSNLIDVVPLAQIWETCSLIANLYPHAYSIQTLFTIVNINLDVYHTDAGTPNAHPSRQYDDFSGHYTEHDNRRIVRNVENPRTYYEGGHTEIVVNNNGNVKAFCAGGLLTGGGFYAGQMTNQAVCTHRLEVEPVLPVNKALAAIYPRSMDQVPSFVLTLMIIPTVLENLFSFIQRTVLGRS